LSEIDRILYDIFLVFERRVDIDGRVRDEKRSPMIKRSFHDEDVTDSTRRAETLLFQDCVHQNVRVQATFHQRRGTTRAAQLHTLDRSIFLCIHFHDGISLDIEVLFISDFPNFALSSYKYRQY
jgi:hypothetical protein